MKKIELNTAPDIDMGVAYWVLLNDKIVGVIYLSSIDNLWVAASFNQAEPRRHKTCGSAVQEILRSASPTDVQDFA